MPHNELAGGPKGRPTLEIFLSLPFEALGTAFEDAKDRYNGKSKDPFEFKDLLFVPAALVGAVGEILVAFCVLLILFKGIEAASQTPLKLPSLWFIWWTFFGAVLAYIVSMLVLSIGSAISHSGED